MKKLLALIVLVLGVYFAPVQDVEAQIFQKKNMKVAGTTYQTQVGDFALLFADRQGRIENMKANKAPDSTIVSIYLDPKTKKLRVAETLEEVEAEGTIKKKLAEVFEYRRTNHIN